MAAITDKQNIGMQTKYDVCYEWSYTVLLVKVQFLKKLL